MEQSLAMAGDSTPPSAPPAEPVAETPKPARLSVAVFPWGDVWIERRSIQFDLSE